MQASAPSNFNFCNDLINFILSYLFLSFHMILYEYQALQYLTLNLMHALLKLILAALLVNAVSSTCSVYANPSQCSQCAIGFYLNTNFTCNLCPIGCSQCYSITYCLSCQPGAYMVNNTCISCGKNCFSCSAGVCQSCIIGFYLSDSNACQTCPNFCSNCTNSTSCATCALGYGFNSSSSQCYLCSGTCNQCFFNTTTSTSECLSCPNSFYLSNS